VAPGKTGDSGDERFHGASFRVFSVE